MNGADQEKLPRRSRTFVGLDMLKTTIAMAVAERGESTSIRVEDRGEISNTTKAVSRLVERLKRDYGTNLHFVYEAGPCGFGLLRRLRSMGFQCDLVAPTSIPKRSGNRVKTDRRDARELARLSAMDYLEPLWVPDPTQEATGDLVRLRMDLKEEVKRQRLSHFLMRQERVWNATSYTMKHRSWMRDLKFEQRAHQLTLSGLLSALEDLENRQKEVEEDMVRETTTWKLGPLVGSLRALRGVDHLSAVTLLAELGDLRRFSSARHFMAYLGLVPSEHSSGAKRRRGVITKTGIRTARRILVEGAWTYRFPARETMRMQRKSADASTYAKDRSWAAQRRLCHRYHAMQERQDCGHGDSPGARRIRVGHRLP
ncbi:MAG: IS110 family transposase [Gammaproteobacteria bacterium]|nr:IS110 family transposase [Gammaproteobacteria bacterium]